MVGRARETRALSDAKTRVSAGAAATVVVVGDAGLGKSRLLAGLRDECANAGWAILQLRCGEFDEHRPFAALRVGLEEFVDRGGAFDSASPFAPGLALLQAPSDTGAAVGEGLGRLVSDRVLDALRALSVNSPVLFLVDDAQWLDDASAQLVWNVARRSTMPVLTAVAMRPSDRDTTAALRRSLSRLGPEFALEPLSRSEAHELAVALRGRDLSPFDESLLDVANGVPFFVTELVSVNPTPTAGASAVAIPSSVRRLLLAQLEPLGPSVRALLADAALLGLTVDIADLAAVTQESPQSIASVLRPAIAAGLLVSEATTVSFRHDLLRSIVEEEMADLDRGARHREIAVALGNANVTATRVAEHHWSSRPLQSDDAANWMRRAAVEVRRFSLRAARVWHERAIALEADPQQQFRDRLALAEVLLLLGEVNEANTIATSHLPVVRGGEDEVRWLIVNASIGAMIGRARSEQAEAHLQDALALLAPSDPRRAEIMGALAMLAAYRGELTRAEHFGEAALKTASEASSTSLAYESLGLAALLGGDVDRALELTSRATAQYSPDAHAIGVVAMPHVARALALLVSSPVAVVHQALDDAYALCERAKNALAVLHLEPLRAIVRFVSGDLLGAQHVIDHVVDAADGWRTRGIALPTITGLDAYLALLHNDEVRANERADDALRELLEGGAQAGSADFALWCVAMVHEAVGGPSKAREILVQAWDTFARDASLLTMTPDLVRLHEPGDAYAAEVVAVVEARAAHSGAAVDVATAMACRAFYAGDRRGLVAAAEALEALGWQLPAARLRTFALDLADVADLDGALDATAARAVERAELEALLAIWQRIGAERPRVGLQDRWRRAGFRTTQPRVLANGLTKTEAAVAELVAEGLTNRQIAERLFMSHRTVESHISRALARLGFTSRVQLTVHVLGGRDSGGELSGELSGD